LRSFAGWTLRGAIQKSIHVYANTRTYEEIARMFPYMADVKKATGSFPLSPASNAHLYRTADPAPPAFHLAGGGDVPAFTWHVFEDDEVLNICGVRVRPLAGESSLLRF
jgi:hypothetical protein